MDHLLEAARHELIALYRTSLPDAAPGSAPWQALALRRDIYALRKDAPPHGLSELSKDLNTYKTFDKVLQQTLTLLDKQAAACANALPFNAIYGPWEGGIDSRLPPKNTVPTNMPAFQPENCVLEYSGCSKHIKPARKPRGPHVAACEHIAFSTGLAGGYQ